MFRMSKLECFKLDNFLSIVNICGLGLDSALREGRFMVLHSWKLRPYSQKLDQPKILVRNKHSSLF